MHSLHDAGPSICFLQFWHTVVLFFFFQICFDFNSVSFHFFDSFLPLFVIFAHLLYLIILSPFSRTISHSFYIAPFQFSYRFHFLSRNIFYVVVKVCHFYHLALLAHVRVFPELCQLCLQFVFVLATIFGDFELFHRNLTIFATVH